MTYLCFQVHEPRVPKDLLEMKTVSNLEFTSVYYGSQPTVFVGSNNGMSYIAAVMSCDVM